jgi:hypothetical protein
MTEHHQLLAVAATIRYGHGTDLDDPEHPDPTDLDLVMLRVADLLEAAQNLADTYAHADNPTRRSR